MKKKTKRPGQFKSPKGTGPAKEDALHQKVSNKGKKNNDLRAYDKKIVTKMV
jgi:hypothetical protein